MALPDSFLQHLRDKGYHPRSNKHSDALAEAIVHDLVSLCPPIAERSAAGQLVYDLNFRLVYDNSEWNTDLAIGIPPPATAPPDDGPIRRTPPSTIQIAIELKSVMTEHRKAVKNRKRDFEAHHKHVHNYSNSAIAGGVMVVNASPTFRSPLRPEVTIHRNVGSLVAHCIREMRNVSMRTSPSSDGLDAKAAVVVTVDNVAWPTAAYVTSAPAPAVGDPMHYDAFIQRLCAEYTVRFAAG